MIKNAYNLKEFERLAVELVESRLMDEKTNSDDAILNEQQEMLLSRLRDYKTRDNN